MCIRSCFLCFIALLFLGACDSSQPVLTPEELNFFQSNKTDSEKERILTLSGQVYSGSQKCSLDSGCLELCHEIYSLEDSQKSCQKLKAQQVYQMEKLYNSWLKKDLFELENINVFDLKVFFNVGSEPLFHFFKSLDLFSLKIFFKWIALNWQTAKVFQEEDDQKLFLGIFLNKLADSPINSLKEPILENRTFIELSWLKQNDFALLWLYDYFQVKLCDGLEGEELENCAIAKYCLAGGSLKEDVSREIVELKFIKGAIKREGDYKDFKSFCSDFCLLQKGQSYCR